MSNKPSTSTVPQGAPPTKRQDVDVESLPNNPLRFERDRESHPTVQISTWNVRGLTTCNSQKRNYGFRLYVEAEDPTILVITEVNESDPSIFETSPDFAFLRSRYPNRYWTQKVAVVSKIAPMSEPVFGFPEGKFFEKEEGKSRLITLEFSHCFLLATYVPNSGAEFKRLPRREAWAKDFEEHIRSLDAKRPVVWAGDFNVIRTKTPTSLDTNDLQWGQSLMGKYSGTHQLERDYHERLLGPQPDLENPRRPGPLFVDVWRLLHGPNARQYTYYGKKMGGWRLDGFIVSERFLHRVRICEIREEVKTTFWPAEGLTPLSDHWPVMLSLEMEEL